MPLRGLCQDFFGIFLISWGRSVGQIIYREYIVFRGLNISCSLAIRVQGSVIIYKVIIVHEV